MKRIDLDDLPPKLAQLLLAAEPGEEVVLVRDGAVLGRLVAAAAAAAAPPPAAAEAAQTPEERAAEIFENFRAAIEEDF